MPLEEVIAGFTGTGFATVPPTIPGLQALGIFGSSKDGKNSNRVAGGPAFTNLTNPPTVGSAWLTVNNGTTTLAPTTGIDSGVVETTAVVSSGWTVFAVARYTVAPGNAAIIGIGSGQGTGCIVLNPTNSNFSSHPAVYMNAAGLVFTPASDAGIDLAGVNLANWRMYALSYPAGSGARPYTISDVTGNTQRTTTTTHSRTGTTNNHFTFGANASPPASMYSFGDVASGGVATGVLSLAQLQSIRTWLLGVESVRGVTGF
jgi:hypothetical protein